MKKINNKGFTLIEVLAVIAIIAILGLVAVPGVLNAINNSKKSSYNILIENIKEAGIRLFDEVDLAGNTVKAYDRNGITQEEMIDPETGVSTGWKDKEVQIIVTEEAEKKYEYIDVSLQTLISNGFIKGTINQKEGATENNQNTLVIMNPITEEDMGSCMIRIKKETSENGKVTYTFLMRDDLMEEQIKEGTCPTTDEYKNGVK